MQGGGAKNNRSVGQQRPSNGGSYVVATIFLVFMVIIMLILFFSVLKPRDPTISVNAVRVASMRVYPEVEVRMRKKSVNLSMSIYFSVNNGNRAAFSYYDTTVQLSYHSHQIALISLPAGKIMSGKTLIVATTLIADPFRFTNVYSHIHSTSTSTSILYVAVQSKIRIIGRVNVLYFFTHHVEASAHCNNNIAVINGALLSFHC